MEHFRKIIQALGVNARDTAAEPFRSGEDRRVDLECYKKYSKKAEKLGFMKERGGKPCCV